MKNFMGILKVLVMCSEHFRSTLPHETCKTFFYLKEKMVRLIGTQYLSLKYLYLFYKY